MKSELDLMLERIKREGPTAPYQKGKLFGGLLEYFAKDHFGQSDASYRSAFVPQPQQGSAHTNADADNHQADIEKWRKQRDNVLYGLAAQIAALPQEDRNVEWGGAAYLDGRVVRSSGLVGGAREDSNPELERFLTTHYADILGFIHNHPSNKEFSGSDASTAFQIEDWPGRNPLLKGVAVTCLIWTEKYGVTPCAG